MESEQRARACDKHRAPGDVELRHPPARRCQAEGCAARGRYGVESPLAALGFCARHRADYHVMLHTSLCKGGGCRKQASFGAAGDASPRFCSAHRGEGDVDLRHGVCTADGCGTIASFGAAGGRFKSCALHKAPGDVNLRYQQRKAVARRKRQEKEREGEWLMQHLVLDGLPAQGQDDGLASPVQMPPRRGGICGGLSRGLPSTRLQGGFPAQSLGRLAEDPPPLEEPGVLL
jgi:hypothetical protein